jgi:hypothetical protein
MAEKAKGKATKTYVTSDDGYTYLIDTIEHEGYLWLVPAWLDAPYQQMRKPARIIRLDKHKLQNLGVEPQTQQHLYRLADPLPKAVLDRGAVHQSKPDTPLVVVEAPELMIRR